MVPVHGPGLQWVELGHEFSVELLLTPTERVFFVLVVVVLLVDVALVVALVVGVNNSLRVDAELAEGSLQLVVLVAELPACERERERKA